VQPNDLVRHLNFLALQTLLRQASAAGDFLRMTGVTFHALLKSEKFKSAK
jgi:hypothetical protein